MADPRRMSPADCAWLGLDRPEHLMIVTAVLMLGDRIELEPLRALVADRLVGAYPTFAQRPVPSRLPLVRPMWRDDPGYDVARHVVALQLAGPIGGRELMDLAAQQMAVPLDLRHAPWTLTLVQGTDGRSALLARLHHCLADGIALAGVLLSLVEEVTPAPDDPGSRRPSPGETGRSAPRSEPGPGPGRVRLVATAFRTAAGALRGGRGSRSGGGDRLRGPASVGRSAAWTAPLDLAVVKTASRARGVTINDVLLAAVAGGLRRWLEGHGQPPTDLRVMVPVDLRRGAGVPQELGNRFGIVFVTLPISVADPQARVTAIRAETSAATSSPVAPASYGLLSLVGISPRRLQGLAAAVLGRIAGGIVTNVPGPRHGLTLAGAPLESVVFWVPHIGSIGVGVSIFSYAGTVTLGVATNSSLDIDAHELVAAVERELAQLTDLTDLTDATAG